MKFNGLATLGIGLAVLVCAAAPANAVLMTTDASFEAVDIFGATLTGSDPQTASSGDIMSLASASGTLLSLPLDFGIGGATETGTVAALALTIVPDGFGLASVQDDAEATWSETYLNTSTTPLGSTLDFTIDGAGLAIADLLVPTMPPAELFDGTGAAAQPMTASFGIEILLDGSPIWQSSAQLTGTVASHVLTEVGTDIGGTPVSDPTGITYEFGPYAGSLDLGTWDPGESFTLAYTINVSTWGPAGVSGAAAYIGDVGGLVGQLPSGGMSATVTFARLDPVIPEPCSMALLLSGLAALVGCRRRSARPR